MVAAEKTAMRRWREEHREYYLAHKRQLAARPEYKAHRQEMYRTRVEGRPKMYDDDERLEMRRQRAR